MRSSPGKVVLPSMSQRVSNVGASSLMRIWRAPANRPVISAKESFAQTISPVVARATTVGSGSSVTAGLIAPPSTSIFAISSCTLRLRSASRRSETMRSITQSSTPTSAYHSEKYPPSAANSRKIT